jgi:hypothetical protein
MASRNCSLTGFAIELAACVLWHVIWHQAVSATFVAELCVKQIFNASHD